MLRKLRCVKRFENSAHWKRHREGCQSVQSPYESLCEQNAYGPCSDPCADPVRVVKDCAFESRRRVGRSIESYRSGNTTEKPVVSAAGGRVYHMSKTAATRDVKERSYFLKMFLKGIVACENL